MKVVIITKTYGRRTLYANISEEALLNLDIEAQNKMILEILSQVMPLHEANKLETRYLIDFKNGKQDIYSEKKKITRPEIDNRTVENWAYAIVDFKKCFLLGKPIQYTQVNDSSTDEIAKLNVYCKYEDKKKKDMEIYEDILTCGRGFRYTNTDTPTEENEAPFEIINLDPEFTEVVYSSGIRKEQLFAFIETPMQYVKEEKDLKTGEIQYLTQFYSEYTIYLRNRAFTVTTIDGGYSVIPDTTQPIALNKHIIREYYINRYRISLIEIGKDLFNDINYLESLDKDDMEQFVNAIMVFTNAEVNENDLQEIRDLGAVSISSTDNKQASVDLLEQRLNANDTQTYYTRLLTSLHQILAVPMASDSGTITSGETGKAKLTGQGYTMAGIRTEGDETQFESCDKKCLDLIITICKNSSESGIKNLKTSDIDSKFSRDTSDNLLTKAQALLNLYQCDIPREVANSVVNLFNDPNGVTKKQQELFGDQTSQLGAGKEETVEEDGTNNFGDNTNTTNKEDLVAQQNNKMQDTQQKDEQNQ